MNDWYFLNSDPAHVARERKKAQELKASQWWKNILGKGLCHYCGKKFPAKQLTMDHIVPVARGGTSTKGNVVPACQKCNQEKKLATPVEETLKRLEEERRQREAEAAPPNPADDSED
jgi:5-methylcytosine-specific restriction enzyme A